VVEPLEPALPDVPDEPPLEPPLEPPPPCPNASETGVSRIAVTNTSVFGRMILLLCKPTLGLVSRSVESPIEVFPFFTGAKAQEQVD
jgi:hypothetical protein